MKLPGVYFHPALLEVFKSKADYSYYSPYSDTTLIRFGDERSGTEFVFLRDGRAVASVSYTDD